MLLYILEYVNTNITKLLFISITSLKKTFYRSISIRNELSFINCKSIFYRSISMRYTIELSFINCKRIFYRSISIRDEFPLLIVKVYSINPSQYEMNFPLSIAKVYSIDQSQCGIRLNFPLSIVKVYSTLPWNLLILNIYLKI